MLSSCSRILRVFIISVADVSGSHHDAGMLMFVFKRTGYLREKPAMTQLS